MSESSRDFAVRVGRRAARERYKDFLICLLRYVVGFGSQRASKFEAPHEYENA
jgi:hypothetical protein